MRRHIYLAGFDYDDHGVHFARICKQRVNSRIKAYSGKEDSHFAVYDCETGTRTSTQVSGSSGTQTTTVTELKKPVTSKSYGKRTFHGHEYAKAFLAAQQGVLSVLDVYKAIQNIGLDDDHTLVEFSIFSHAGHTGPILVNSFDELGAGSPRDPNDMDPRTLKDFVSPTMHQNKLDCFKSAFHSQALIWVWGCNAAYAFNELLSAIENNAAYRGGKVEDAALFRFKYLGIHALDLVTYDLASVIEYSAKTKVVAVEFKWLKWLLCSYLASTYMQKLAYVIGLPTYGAPLGAGASYDAKAAPSPLMRVAADAAPHIRFHQKQFGLKLDPEDRGYVQYLPGFECVMPVP